MNIGVLSLQGAFLKHIQLLKQIGVNPIQVRYEEDLLNLHGLIIPGGESTVLSKLIIRQSLYEPMEKFISKYPVYGTCAGLILLSRIIENNKIVKGSGMAPCAKKSKVCTKRIKEFNNKRYTTHLSPKDKCNQKALGLSSPSIIERVA